MKTGTREREQHPQKPAAATAAASPAPGLNVVELSITSLLLQYASFFAFGGSNAVSSVDLSSAYNGAMTYSVNGTNVSKNITRQSFAANNLTGKYRGEKDLSQSPRGQKVKAMLNDRGLRILRALDEVAQHHNTDQAAVALAWLMARPSITAPIASATRPEQVDSLAAAAELALTGEEIRRLDEASAEWASAA